MYEKKINILKEASEESKRLFSNYARVRNYKKGEAIFRDKEEVGCFYFLLSGYVSLYKISSNHEKKVIFICKAGEILNEVMVQKEFASIYAEPLSECEIVFIDKRKLRMIMENDFSVAEAMMESMASKIRRLYRQLKNTPNAVRMDQQLASKIWKLGRDFGVETERGIEVKFDITISFLAEMLGAKRETVSRQFKHLVNKKMVELNRRRLCILNMDLLQEYLPK